MEVLDPGAAAASAVQPKHQAGQAGLSATSPGYVNIQEKTTAVEDSAKMIRII